MTDPIIMHGLSFDGTGEIEEQEVVAENVQAYKMQGWVEGPKPVDVEGEAASEDAPKTKKTKGK